MIIPDDIMLFLVMVANMTKENNRDFYRTEAQKLIDKYKRSPAGPSEYKEGDNTTQTPVLHFRV